MPELADALHSLFEEEARVQVSPSRTMNALTGEARSARRRAQARSVLVGATGAMVAAALVVAGVHVLDAPTTPLATPSGSVPTAAPATVPVTWNPTADADAAMAGFAVPSCGETFAPQQATVGDVRAVANVRFDDTVQIGNLANGPQFHIFARFDSTDGALHDLLAAYPGYVITRDDVVVAVDSTTEDNIELFSTGMTDAAANTVAESAFSYYACEANAAVDALYKEHNWDPNAEHTDAEKQEMGALEDAVRSAHSAWPAGTYQVYYVTPVIFGEQLAVAQEIKARGVSQVAWVRSDIGSTPYGHDDRLAPYCYDSNDSWYCQAPQDVIDQVLTFRIDPSTIDNTPSGVAVSAPVTVTVP